VNAEVALRAWGGGSLRPIKDRENAVYEVKLTDGRRAALRLHREGYQSAESIRSELWWMQAVALAGVPVPLPVPSGGGDLVHILPDGRVATMISWVEGDELGAAEHALGGSQDEKCGRFDAIGQLVARLHNVTDTLVLPDWFCRHYWDADGFLGETPFWGRFWENPTLRLGELDTIQSARTRAGEQLAAFVKAEADFGLIHADVLRENVLFGADGAVLIDFDDCGFGFRIYDLATLASQNETEADHAKLMSAAIAGYRKRRPLSEYAEAMLPCFVMLRRFASCGWIVPRAAPDDPQVRLYTKRAVDAAQRFLAD